MTNLVVTPPRTREEIAGELRSLHERSVQLYATISTPEFVTRRGEIWSPADHVRHLTKTMRAVTRGLRIPRLVLWWKFGKAKQPSRSYDEVVTAYRTRLETFDGRNNPFAPAALKEVHDVTAWRSEVMGYHEVALSELVSNLLGWSEQRLDSYVLPHPLLGKMTVRELLFFTLYHNLHHVRIVAARKQTV